MTQDHSKTASSLAEQREAELERLRDRFFKRTRQEVLTWGEESLDLAWSYYPASIDHEDPKETEGLPRLIVDRIHLPRVGSECVDFISSVRDDWWSARSHVSASTIGQLAEPDEASSRSGEKPESEGGDQPVEAICAFYSRYLNASGFTLVIEFNHQHLATPEQPPILWRVDARSEGTQIVYPRDEGDFYDQLGAYLDLRVGWAWLIQQSEQRNALVTAEVEPGYLIGVRPGDPMSDEDPAEREDPEIEAVFSRFDVERFDTLEFLNFEDADHYPFQAERFDHWLPIELGESLLSQRFEAFVLSQSERFFEAVEEVAQRRKVEVNWGESEESASVILRRGPVWLERPLSLPYLWTLHSGRQHYEGAVDFFRDDLDRVYLASELYFGVRQHLGISDLDNDTAPVDLNSLEVTDGAELIIKSRDSGETLMRPRVKVPLIDWAAESVFSGREGAALFLKLWGWSAEELSWSEPKHSLNRCPLCEREARVTRALRPRHESQEPTLIGASLTTDVPDPLWGYYALNCPQHHLPVFWESADRLQEQIGHQTHHVLDITMSARAQLGDVEIELLWGDELAGELLSPSTRESLRDRGALYAYAFTPDLIALSLLPLDAEDISELSPSVNQLIARYGPDRDWRLEWSLPLL